MIDIAAETVVTMTDAAKRLPARRKGKRPHVATLYRWATRGLRGIRLESVQVGGTLCTSIEALQRFFNTLTGAAPAEMPGETRERKLEIEQAMQNLKRKGL